MIVALIILACISPRRAQGARFEAFEQTLDAAASAGKDVARQLFSPATSQAWISLVEEVIAWCKHALTNVSFFMDETCAIARRVANGCGGSNTTRTQCVDTLWTSSSEFWDSTEPLRLWVLAQGSAFVGPALSGIIDTHWETTKASTQHLFTKVADIGALIRAISQDVHHRCWVDASFPGCFDGLCSASVTIWDATETMREPILAFGLAAISQYFGTSIADILVRCGKSGSQFLAILAFILREFGEGTLAYFSQTEGGVGNLVWAVLQAASLMWTKHQDCLVFVKAASSLVALICAFMRSIVTFNPIASGSVLESGHKALQSYDQALQSYDQCRRAVISHSAFLAWCNSVELSAGRAPTLLKQWRMQQWMRSPQPLLKDTTWKKLT